MLTVGPMISEFMALNNSTLKDADGDYSDWIEIHNTGAAPVNLNGWSLTDDAAMLGKWHFPDVTIDSGGYLVVFASGKNRSIAGSELHTNFQLSGDGEYLALVEPDGASIATQFAPFPAQHADVSYGIVEQTETLVAAGAASKTLIPSDNTLGLSWTGGQALDDGSWIAGPTGVGYDTSVGSEPAAYWNLNEAAGATAADSGGNGYAGAIHNAAWTTGINGTSALNFNGTSSWVDLGNPAGLNITGQVTLSAWIKPTATDGIRYIIVHGYSSSPKGEVALRINGGSYQILSWNGANHMASAAIPSGDLGTWVHLAGTYDGTAWKLYRNGVLLATANDATGAVAVNVDWAIGARGTGTERFFQGGIDDVAIWNTALSSAQIQTLAQGASPLGYNQLIGTNVNTAMRNVNSSAYLRIPFTVAAPADVQWLRFDMQYDDGYVAWLNGVEIGAEMLRRPSLTIPRH